MKNLALRESASTGKRQTARLVLLATKRGVVVAGRMSAEEGKRWRVGANSGMAISGDVLSQTERRAVRRPVARQRQATELQRAQIVVNGSSLTGNAYCNGRQPASRKSTGYRQY
ncbi:hypothetical protein KCP74_13765 [Salmonella enterica subsp. enterica]|nr:hypothetical protein KCP74_13765 [Salmonella enterica subsp. enterica]